MIPHIELSRHRIAYLGYNGERMLEQKPYRVCYFGIYPLRFPRDIVYLRGLEQKGVSTLPCIDSAKGWRKYWNLYQKHRLLKDEYDILFVTYLSSAAAILASLISKRPIIYNALNSTYESIVLERAECRRFSLKGIGYWCLDFLSFHGADITLVESDEQKAFIRKTFFVSESKLQRMWTSADERDFFPDPSVTQREKFTAIFRGQLAPFVGIEHVVDAARILEKEGVDVIIRGWGMLTPKVKEMIARYKLTNVTLMTEYQTAKEMRELMLSCHVSLGQFADHERAERTIANKSFETIAVGMPFITGDLAANRELFTNEKDALLVAVSSAQAIADAVIRLRDDMSLRKKLAAGGHALFLQQASVGVLGEQLLRTFSSMSRG